MTSSSLITINDLFLSIGQANILTGINLEVDESDFCLIKGASGSGKSTLLSVMGLMKQADKGIIYFNGNNTASLKDRELAKIRNQNIGFVFQSFNLMSDLNVLDNVMLPHTYSKQRNTLEARTRGIDLLTSLGLKSKLSSFPHELSGGQQQRVSIARALINNPSIVLADEPTGNLDSKSSNDIFSILSDVYSTGVSIVVVSHESEIRSEFNKFLYMSDGLLSEG